jgi:hypothetical protein
MTAEVVTLTTTVSPEITATYAIIEISICLSAGSGCQIAQTVMGMAQLTVVPAQTSLNLLHGPVNGAVGVGASTLVAWGTQPRHIMMPVMEWTTAVTAAAVVPCSGETTAITGVPCAVTAGARLHGWVVLSMFGAAVAGLAAVMVM